MSLFDSKAYRIIDISQPIDSRSACFPGDTPFSKTVTLTYEKSQVVNLTSITMSPHVGTHADSPIHIYGDLTSQFDTAGAMAVEKFLGTALVVNLAPYSSEITLDFVKDKLERFKPLPPCILWRCQNQVRYDQFLSEYAYLSVDLIDYLADHGCALVGVDSPSVDHIDSKTLPIHHKLRERQLVWLENLDLSQVRQGSYFLIALPLKFMELEASPVRAVLLEVF